jgi:uncharacterized protein involved in copper resistance
METMMDLLSVCPNCDKPFKSQHACPAPRVRYIATLLADVTCERHGNHLAATSFETRGWLESDTITVQVKRGGMDQDCRIPRASVTLHRV